ncbi:MAG: hypothetical protein EOO84_22540, partial [Pantoea sp.]|uniref:cullin family protein n=1 Tax=Pantoea sp. TaxID=69393 RepID=UPI0012025870
FMYLSDKDFFSEVYRNQLAKRLLNQRSASDDMERAMIGKLKSRSGTQFTGKMEGMLTDLAIGQEQSLQFEKFCKDHPDKLGKLSFGVQILTTGHWPQYKPYNEIALPTTMLKCMETFKTYYDATTNSNKRKLTWVYSLGNVSIKGSFNNFKKSYDINVTTVQAAVMLMFNTYFNINTGNPQTDRLLQQGIVSFTYLQETLNMPEDVLKKVLHSLCFAKFKVLKKVGAAEVNKAMRLEAAGEEEKDSKPVVKKTDHFQFNDAFR